MLRTIGWLSAPALLRISLAALAAYAAAIPADAQGNAPAKCEPQGPLVELPDLPEASGIAASRRAPNRLWAHNDSGKPLLFALDTNGSVTGRVQLSGIEIEDWEAVAVGPCPDGSCIYVGDIGDNEAARKHVTVYRLPEPSAPNASVQAKETFHATYPDGAHDAEALLVTPAGDILIVTKGETGGVALYRFPKELRSDDTHRLELVAKPNAPRKTRAGERITDGAVSPKGDSVVLRSRDQLVFHRTGDLLAGKWQPVATVDLKPMGEPQGEAVAVGERGTVFLAGEGGGQSRPGTFRRATCR